MHNTTNKILCKWGKHELPSYVVPNSNILKLLPCKICGWDIYTNKQVKPWLNVLSAVMNGIIKASQNIMPLAQCVILNLD